MAYQTIHTLYGLNRMAVAEASGIPINLTQMAVGDGNGNPTSPQLTQTSLVREKHRLPINRIYQNESSQTQYVAEVIIPKDKGGFTLREMAIYDDAGSMFVVANLPDVYIPAEGEGAFSDAIVRCIFEVSNAEVVTLMVDPNVAVASQQWVINNITSSTIIPGGLTYQVLAKRSNLDGDVEWIDITQEINITVDVIEEPQTLALNQTQVDLTKTNTDGLAIYIEGLRLRRGSGTDEWRPNPANEYTSIVLGKSYPAGSRIVMVQNDPMGNAIEPLEKHQNLADIPNKPLARNNLDVFSKEETRQMAPPGMLGIFAMNTAPAGWLKANGALLSRTVYADLFAAIGTTYPGGDGATTFRLPDFRGEFLRAWDDGRGVDGGRAFGSYQDQEIQSHNHGASAAMSGQHSHGGTTANGGTHNHSASTGGAGDHVHGGLGQAGFDVQGGGSSGTSRMNYGDNWPYNGLTLNMWAGNHTHSVSVGDGGNHNHSLNIQNSGSHNHTITIDNRGGHETRPRNAAVLVCIKY